MADPKQPQPVPTLAGQNLLGKTQAGKVLNFTRIGIGAGDVGAPYESAVDIADQRIGAPITDITVDGGEATITYSWSNAALATGFFISEIVLFAEDPDTAEELAYVYVHFPEGARPYVPATGGTTVVEALESIIAIVAGADPDNISATINTSLIYATRSWVNEQLALLGGVVRKDELLGLLGADAARVAQTPVYPLIQTASRAAAVTSPAAGTVALAETPWLWRGIVPLTLEAATFPTAASRRYVLRAAYDPGAGTTSVALRDVADAGYNPGGLPYDDPSFDAGFDELILADVVTDAGNVATITPIANAPDLSARFSQAGSPIRDNGANGAVFRFDMPLAWARRPEGRDYADRKIGMNNGFTDLDQNFRATDGIADIDEPIVTRRGTLFSRLYDFATQIDLIAHFRA